MTWSNMLLLIGVLDVCVFLLVHICVTRYGQSVVWSKVVSTLLVFCVGAALLLLLTTPARADVISAAECSIAANKRLRVGPELKRAERECYRKNLPKGVADEAYANRGSSGDRLIITEVQQGPAQAAQPVPTYPSIERWPNSEQPLRYPYPYGPPPKYQGNRVQITSPR